MQLLTKQILANTAAERYKSRYYDTKKGWLCIHSGSVYNRLVELGSTPKPQEVDNIIGEKFSTILPSCSFCGHEPKNSLVIFDINIRICRQCVECAYSFYDPSQFESMKFFSE